MAAIAAALLIDEVEGRWARRIHRGTRRQLARAKADAVGEKAKSTKAQGRAVRRVAEEKVKSTVARAEAGKEKSVRAARAKLPGPVKAAVDLIS